jgi:hypothetical protein
MYLKRIAVCTVLVLFFLLFLCSCDSSGTPGNAGAITPTLQSGTVVDSTAGVGPITVLTETPVPGGETSKQPVTLHDRTLTVEKVSTKAGTDATSTSVSITISIVNTGKTPIMNEAGFYELEGAEGDSFGSQSSVTPNFYGAIAPLDAESPVG